MELNCTFLSAEASVTAKRRAGAYGSIGIRTEERISAPTSLLPLALHLSSGAVGTQK